MGVIGILKIQNRTLLSQYGENKVALIYIDDVRHQIWVLVAASYRYNGYGVYTVSLGAETLEGRQDIKGRL